MSKATCILRGVALACALSAAGAPAMAAKDPARWTQGDSTKAQRMATLKKEINAAYADQQSACKHKASSKRSACLQQARQVYQRDMANAPRLLAQAPQGGVTERVVATTTAPAPAASPAAGQQDGATAYGSSGAGMTGSSGSNATGSSGAGATGSSGPTGYGSSVSGSTGAGGDNTGVVPPAGQAGGLPPPRMDQPDMQAPTQPPAGDTPPIQQQ